MMQIYPDLRSARRVKVYCVLQTPMLRTQHYFLKTPQNSKVLAYVRPRVSTPASVPLPTPPPRAQQKFRSCDFGGKIERHLKGVIFFYQRLYMNMHISVCTLLVRHVKLTDDILKHILHHL